MKSCTWMLRAAALACTFGAFAPASHAELFYSCKTRGLPGESVHLDLNLRAGTVLEAIDIVPELDAVASVLSFQQLVATPALTEGGSGFCENNGCVFSYLPEKTVAQDTLLATLHFKIAASAPVGPVDFDAGVTFGSDLVPIPAGAGFEVLAIPEPGTSWMVALGLVGVAAVATRRRRG